MKVVSEVGNNSNVLAMEEGNVTIAVNQFGQGRSVYIAGLPYTAENTRLLLLCIYWSASQEQEMNKWFTTNPNMQRIQMQDLL
ncbi:hypothetical protein J2S74_001482 [Evansella vedderi]|uniref:Lacto-N-biose phosphorylase central domain-containing protein n=1 Tax=Evansella vedderi TaxID=38282 RepID=A0ABT9ZTD8_9BACI|nr:hypothetical protein [Evansella vedderi]